MPRYSKRHVRWLGETKATAKPIVLAEPFTSAPDYAAMTKAALVGLAERAGVDTSGTKAEIAERLRG
jgi:hypothetical protein